MIWPWNKHNYHESKTEELERAVSIEVQGHQDTADEVVAQAQKIADNFVRVVNNNGFTLLITVGASKKDKK